MLNANIETILSFILLIQLLDKLLCIFIFTDYSLLDYYQLRLTDERFIVQKYANDPESEGYRKQFYFQELRHLVCQYDLHD